MAEIKQERNRAIYEAINRGEKVNDLAEQYGVSVSLIQSIYKKELKKMEKRQNPLYQMISIYCEDERLCTKIFTVLTRLNATTEEEFMKLNRKFLLRYARNCGEVMVNIIEKVQDDIRNDAETIVEK